MKSVAVGAIGAGPTHGILEGFVQQAWTCIWLGGHVSESDAEPDQEVVSGMSGDGVEIRVGGLRSWPGGEMCRAAEETEVWGCSRAR